MFVGVRARWRAGDNHVVACSRINEAWMSAAVLKRKPGTLRSANYLAHVAPGTHGSFLRRCSLANSRRCARFCGPTRWSRSAPCRGAARPVLSRPAILSESSTPGAVGLRALIVVAPGCAAALTRRCRSAHRGRAAAGARPRRARRVGRYGQLSAWTRCVAKLSNGAAAGRSWASGRAALAGCGASLRVLEFSSRLLPRA